MKAIVVAVLVVSENRAEGLIRPVNRGDGRRDSRDALLLQTPLRWGTPRRKTARPGPSPTGEWMMCGSGESHEHQDRFWGRAKPDLRRTARQREEPRRGRVFPSPS